MENPYQILGVPNDASIGDIKKAYKKLCLVFIFINIQKWHPDKNRDSGKSK